VWLSVWSEVQTCIWPSWCHCHSLSLCFSKIQIGFTSLVLAHPGSPGQRAIKQVCVCVRVSSSIYYNPQYHLLQYHLPCSIYMLDSPFPQPLSRSSLVFLLVWDPLLHTPEAGGDAVLETAFTLADGLEYCRSGTLLSTSKTFLHPVIFFLQHMYIIVSRTISKNWMFSMYTVLLTISP